MVRDSTPSLQREHLVVSEAISAEPWLRQRTKARSARGRAVALHIGAAPAHLERAGRELAERGADRIVVVGGDGTVNAVVNGIMQTDARPELGIVPAGTANDLAGSLGLPPDPREMLDQLWSGRTGVRDIDLIRCNDRYFANVLSIGTPARVTRETPVALKQALGGLAYLAYGISRLGEAAPFPAVLEADGLRWAGRALAIYVGNGDRAGGGFRVCPDADMTDGRLDLLLVPEMDAGNLLALMGDVTVLGDPRHHEFVEHHRLDAVDIRVPEGVQVNVDGEPIEDRTLSLAVERAALTVRVPLVAA